MAGPTNMTGTIGAAGTITVPGRKARSIAITAGKGGVGKSNFAVNLAIELGGLGKRVLLLDADYGLANADLLCGLSPKFHLGHVVSGLKELEDIVLEISENVHLVPGGSGIEELVNFSLSGRSDTCRKLREMESEHDFMLIDTAAGIGSNVVDVLASAGEVVVIATPEPTAVVDAYATIKVILKYSPGKTISVLVNNVVTLTEANKVFTQLDSAVSNFLGRRLDFLGMVPLDARVQEAVREQIPVVHYAPQSPASRATRLIAKQFCQQVSSLGNNFSQSSSFWTALTAD
jgi:flagellar biosynthesis protein FlhG